MLLQQQELLEERMRREGGGGGGGGGRGGEGGRGGRGGVGGVSGVSGAPPSATQQQHMSPDELVSELAALERRVTEQHARRERAARLGDG